MGWKEVRAQKEGASMFIPEVKRVTVYGAEYVTCARVTLDSVLTVRQEDYLRALLNAFYRSVRVFSRMCFQVAGSEILFRVVSVPRLRNPTPDEIGAVLSAMNLVAEPEPLPRQRKRSKVSAVQHRAEASI